MLKVCSYPRSGKHLLMAMLHANFDFGIDLATEENAFGLQWADGKRTTLDVPWGALFGSHLMLDQTDHAPADVLYLMRHPVEVMRSNWEFNGADITMNEHATDEKLTYWKEHVETYTQRCFFVTYEDLMTKPVATLDKIRTQFGLKRNNKEWQSVTDRVGWLSPRKAGPREGFSVSTLLRFQDILGNRCMGYRL